MINRVVVRKSFLVPAKKLAKRYRSFQSDVEGLINRLKANPDLGVPLGQNVFKIRLAVASKGKGKRGGARVITYVYRSAEIVYLMSVYDKADRDNISHLELKDLVDEIEAEFD